MKSEKGYSGKTVGVLLICLLAAATVLPGCGRENREPGRELRIREETAQLEKWQESLESGESRSTLNPNAIRGLSVVREGETVFQVSYEPKTYKESFDFWDISVPYESVVSVDTERLYELFGTVANLTFTPVTGVSFEEAGITGSQTSLFVAYDGEQEEGEKGRAEPTHSRTISVGKQDGSGNYYVGIEGDNSVYLASEIWVNSILNLEPYEYILKVPYLVGIDTVEAVKLTAKEENLLLRISDNSWEIGGKEVSQSAFHQVYNQLLSVLIADEIGAGEAKEGQREPFLQMVFYRKSEEAPDVEVKFYVQDEDYMTTVVNGKEFFLVSRKNVEGLKQILEDY